MKKLTPLQREIVKYIWEYYFNQKQEKTLPPSPDTLPHVLQRADSEAVQKAILGLIEMGLVKTVSFHNWLDLTELGHETFKSEFGEDIL